MPKILVGADPELFMINPNSGEFVSAEDVDSGPRVPGTKYEPFKVPYGAVQIDGTALEFNIDPAANVDDFVRNINSVRSTLCSFVPGYNVVAEPVARFDAEYFLWKVPSSAQALGCEPDYCGWTAEQNPRPDPNGQPFRTASGHVHIGWTENMDINDPNHFEFACRIARQMDYYLGIHSLLWDQDATRRTLYGKAGAFRVKTYGMEYRVLSNRWLQSDELICWVYNTVQAGMADAFANVWAEDTYGDLAQDIINNNVINWPVTMAHIDLNLEEVPISKAA